MSAHPVILFVSGLVALIVGAEALVRGASRLAAAIGLSSLVIGVTVVAYGTSAPELAVGIQSAWKGQADIALGNVVGSNIFNVLFILGVSAVLVPLVVSRQLVRLDVPVMIAVSALLLLLGLDGKVGRLDGLFLFAGALVYTAWAVHQGRKENAAAEENGAQSCGTPGQRLGARVLTQIVWIGVGLALLVLGSRWLLNGAVALARALQVSELVIGLTIVAAGTSLPEIATSVIASIRGERDIAVGNVVGSNIFNILLVLGLCSAVSPHGVSVAPAALSFDVPVMIAVAAACLPIFFTGHRIARWEGALFLGYYVAYTLYLILDAVQHDALHGFSVVMAAFVLPLTAVTLLVLAFRAARANRSGDN